MTGASGNAGSQIVRALSELGTPVRALVRDPSKVAILSALPGVEIVKGDLLDKASLRRALAGVERAILISTANETMVEAQCSFIDSAKEAGIPHVVKFSGEEGQQGFDPSRFRYTQEHETIEDYLESSGLVWTHLRPSQFMQVYLREAAGIRQTGELRLPFEDITMSPVDLRDIAQIAAKLLVHGGFEGRALPITGPEALSMAAIAGIISEVTNKPVKYIPISIEERSNTFRTAGVPDYFIKALEEQAAERRRNPIARVDVSTHQLFGVKPTHFKEFLSRHAGLFSTN